MQTEDRRNKATNKEQVKSVRFGLEVAILKEQKKAINMTHKTTTPEEPMVVTIDQNTAASSTHKSAMPVYIEYVKVACKEAIAAREANKDNPNKTVATLAGINNDEALMQIIWYAYKKARAELTTATDEKEKVIKISSDLSKEYHEANKRATCAAQQLKDTRTHEEVAIFFINAAGMAISDYKRDRLSDTRAMPAMQDYVESAKEQVEAAKEATKKAQEVYAEEIQEVETIKQKQYKVSRKETAVTEEHKHAEKIFKEVNKITSLFLPPGEY